MKIKEIRTVEIDVTPRPKTQPRTPSRAGSWSMARPIERYAGVQSYPTWKRVACIVTAEDGTTGFGLSLNGPIGTNLIDHQFAPALIGQDCMATEKMWDMMVRLCAPFGGMGLASYAISAVDVALWDLKGKLLERPVYELLGGPQKERIPCYATGFDTEWYLEMGFKATKIFTPWGPKDGLDGIHKNVELVAKTRELVGDKVELMLDCWMTPDPEYAVRLIELLRPYGLKWVEEFVAPDDLVSYARVRERVGWQTLASGEHWYLPKTFFAAASRGLVDILQPDVLWCGGLTAALKICHMAEAAGLNVITHAGMNYPFGQHLALAMPVIPWGERSESVSAPGVPLAEMTILPGTPAIEDGYVRPSDAPGFGLEITDDWIEARSV